ncbi:MAG: hypothetical protein WD492_18460 [Alkalispirochaeta sp.]
MSTIKLYHTATLNTGSMECISLTAVGMKNTTDPWEFGNYWDDVTVASVPLNE